MIAPRCVGSFTVFPIESGSYEDLVAGLDRVVSDGPVAGGAGGERVGTRYRGRRREVLESRSFARCRFEGRGNSTGLRRPGRTVVRLTDRPVGVEARGRHVGFDVAFRDGNLVSCDGLGTPYQLRITSRHEVAYPPLSGESGLWVRFSMPPSSAPR
jgi:hypothetical protein